jgi:hypothetical protein
MNLVKSIDEISAPISSKLSDLGYTYIQYIGSGGYGTAHLVYS